MAKGQKRTRKAPAEQSKAEQRAREDERRVRRELGTVRRVAQLSKQLESAAARAEVNTFALGRELVTRAGWSVAKPAIVNELREENERLRSRLAELEAELAEQVRGAAVERV